MYRPMLQYIFYVLAPIPYVFFGPVSESNGWQDVGKFFMGFTGAGIIAIPSILLHARIIVFGAFMLQICGLLSLGIAAGIVILSQQDGGGGDYFAI